MNIRAGLVNLCLGHPSVSQEVVGVIVATRIVFPWGILAYWGLSTWALRNTHAG